MEQKENIQLVNNENNKIKIGKNVECSKCSNDFLVERVNRTGKYGLKNNWGYWTEKKENENKYICSPCLRNMYYRDYEALKEEVNSRKMNTMRTYICLKLL